VALLRADAAGDRHLKAEDVTDTLQLALTASGCDQARVVHKPRLLSDNGPSYISGELAEWLDEWDIAHVRGAPNHPQTQGKIERWHRTLKNRILLENAIDAMGSVETGARELLISTEAGRENDALVIVRNSGSGMSRACFRGFLHHEVKRHGNGPVDLPIHHRGARRPIVDEREPAARRQLSIRPAGDPKHCVVMLHL
jgi:hypothetical protein